MRARVLPKAVLFDMDGLLIDSERIAQAALVHAATEIGHPIPTAVAQRLIGLGRDSGDVVLRDAFGSAFPLERFWHEWWSDYKRRLTEGVPAKAGALQALQALALAGIACAVATSTETSYAHYKLDKAGLRAHIGAVAGRDAVKHGKPAPDLYLRAAEMLGVMASTCWAFEDSLPGLKAAVAAGARTHWVPDLAEIAVHELPLGVERVASLAELPGWLAESSSESATPAPARKA